MARLEIERIGGLAGFGLPGSSLRARGACDLGDLSESNRRLVDDLLSGGSASSGGGGDQFLVRLTVRDGSKAKTVEVPESQIPAELTQLIKNELS